MSQFQQVAVVENKTKSKIKDDSRFQIFYKLRSSQVKENQEYFVATVSFLWSKQTVSRHLKENHLILHIRVGFKIKINQLWYCTQVDLYKNPFCSSWMNTYHLTGYKSPCNMNFDHIAYLLQRRILDEIYKCKNRCL